MKRKKMAKIGVNRRGEYKEVNACDLSIKELCDILDDIKVDYSDAWFPEQARDEGYTAINEAIRRLKSGTKKK
jgi:hypothetical protein